MAYSGRRQKSMQYTTMLASLLLLVSAAIEASAPPRWYCSNPDTEVRCFEGQCNSASGDDFTPVSLAFDDQGMMELCAYTGCWQGQAQVLASNSLLLMQAESLTFSTAPDRPEMEATINLLFDSEARLAFVRADFFAQPLYCRPSR